LNVREFKADKARIFIEFLLLWRRQFPKDLLDTEQLVDLWLTREERLTVSDLAHDAASRPNVNFFTVVWRQKQFRRSVPPSRHVISETSARFWIQNAGKTKVANFKFLSLGVNQQVFWLDVTVDHVVTMTVLNRFENLIEVEFNVL
jgi:hypothetical protein